MSHPEVNTYRAGPTAPKGRFAIIVARFNETITGRMLDGAIETLVARGVAAENIDVAWVPGAFEIPTVAQQMAAGGRYAAVICLGAVIRGETTHDQWINQSVSGALAQIGARTGLPVIFGVLTCNTLEQAIARSGGHDATTGKDVGSAKVGNKGVDAAEAALEMVNLLAQLRNAAGPF